MSSAGVHAASDIAEASEAAETAANNRLKNPFLFITFPLIILFISRSKPRDIPVYSRPRTRAGRISFFGAAQSAAPLAYDNMQKDN